MIELQAPEGRLLTVRIASPVTLEEVQQLAQQIEMSIKEVGRSVVIAGDLRDVGVVPPDVGQAFVGLMQSDNAHLDAAGHLVGDSVIEGMQVERLLNEAQNPNRRGLRTATEVVSFLQKHLEPSEVEALRRFVG
jgi:hypothetical protein